MTASRSIADEKLEVVLGVAMKTISNYTDHIAGTELDAAFADFAWQKPSSTDN